MPRYVIERNFPTGLNIPMSDQGAQACLGVIAANANEGVTWIHSYVSADKTKTFCIYDGPDPEAVRRAANDNNLPLERITQVNVLAPYFYH